MFNPDYKSPLSVQMNVGVQRELKSGLVLSVDYIRNVGTRYLLGIDENHAGTFATSAKPGLWMPSLRRTQNSVVLLLLERELIARFRA